MKKTLIFAMIAVLCAAFMVSCSDSSSSSSDDSNKEFFLLKKGNYWNYAHYKLDTLTKQVIPDSTQYDSVFVPDDQISKGGIMVYLVKTSKKPSGRTIEDYMYTQNKALWALSSYILPDEFQDPIIKQVIPADLLDIWLKIADANASVGQTWQIYSKQFDNDTVTLLGYKIIINGKLQITGTKFDEESVTYGTEVPKTVTARKFVVSIAIVDGTFSSEITSGKITFSMNRQYWYADKIGLVKEYTEPTAFNASAPIIGNIYSKRFLGESLNLINTNLP